MGKFSDYFEAQKKSKIKAGDGLSFGKYKFFNSSNIQTKFYDEAQYNNEALIFGTGGNASIHYCNEPFSTSTDCIVFFAKRSDFSVKLVYQYLSGNIYILQNGFKGAGIKHISKGYIEDIELNLPVLEKQYQIVATLDKATHIIEICNKILEKLNLLVKAKFAEMFGDIFSNIYNYPISTLSEYILFLTSGSRGWARYCTNNGNEWFITIKNVKDCKILLDNMQSVNAPNNMEAKRTKVKEDDLLISITADLGRTGIVTKEIAEHGAYINQHLTCVRLDKSELIPLFVAYFLESESGKSQFEAKNQTGVKAGLNFDSIKSLELLVPPVELQKKFADFVKQVNKSKSAVKQVLEKAETLKKSLMQEYFGQ